MIAPPIAPPPDPVHYLLVDDLEENLTALEALLRRDGLVLLRARSGLDALELLLKHDVALALIDVRMPGMDGFELAELIRGAERTRRIPIIFLTAGATDQQRRFRGYEAGAVDFLCKPIEPDVLRSKTDVFFDLYRQRQEVARQRDELRAATDENMRLLRETQTYAEALQQADRRKDTFLALLAHELRNPLAPLRNGLEVLRLADHDPAARRGAREMMDRQLLHLIRLVDDLLDISRITSEKMTLRRSRVLLSDVVHSAVETARPLIDEAGHELIVSLPDDPIHLDADLTRLAQVFGNLLTNSAKYTPPGGVIRLDATLEGGEAVVSVRDTGIGIPASALPDIFDMFSQVGRSVERHTGGLGIGLALVRGLVEMHGGAVEAHSDGPGQGTQFTVRLRALRASNSDGRPLESPHPIVAATPASRKFRVLVVDDNRDSADSLALMLRMFGNDVMAAYDGDEALETAQSFHPEVMLLDLGMPRVNGYETARLIRQRPGGKNITLIAQTGWGQEADLRRTAEAGFDRHLVKPVDPSALMSLLTELRRQ